MKELFRASVMLAVLVGLPAAWIYYGPLPPSAQKVVDRAVEVVKDATGWQQPYEQPQEAKTAPRFGHSASPAPLSIAPPHAEMSLETTRAQSPPAPENLNEQLQPQLERLRALGPEVYALEAWGSGGKYYRFRCDMPLGDRPGFTQQFEAVAESPAACIGQVTAEIERWKSTRNQLPGSGRIAQHEAISPQAMAPQSMVRQ